MWTNSDADEPDDLADLTVDELVGAVHQSEEIRRSGRRRTGRLLAELHGRGELSWPTIARLTGVRQTTAYDLAKPYLAADGEHGSAP